jgi:LPXTG-motif cell wall-anchored protein
VGVAYSFDVDADDATATFSATGLPGGLTIDSTSGVISGGPTTSGTFTVEVTATNADGTDVETYTVEIAPAPPIEIAPTFTTTILPAGAVGTPYTATVVAAGTPTPTFSATGLPPGLTMDASGVISGTPTTSGSFAIEVTASNSAGDRSEIYGVFVAAAPAVPGPTQSPSLPTTGIDPTPTVLFGLALLLGGIALAVVRARHRGLRA